MEDFQTSLTLLGGIPGNKHNTNTILWGDFNFGDIDWEQVDINTGAQNISACNHFIDMLYEFHLTKTQREPTRGDRVLGLDIAAAILLWLNHNCHPGDI